MTKPTVEFLTLSTPLVDAILGYLGSRPYVEVERLIQGISSQVAPQLQPPAEPAEPKAE